MLFEKSHLYDTLGGPCVTGCDHFLRQRQWNGNRNRDVLHCNHRTDFLGLPPLHQNRSVVSLTTTSGSNVPCNLSPSVETYDTTSGVTHGAGWLPYGAATVTERGCTIRAVYQRGFRRV